MSTRRKPQSRNPAARPGARPSDTRDGRDGGAPGADGTDAAPVGGVTKAAAVGLWAVVGVGLAYGISQTAVKVVALFS